MTGIIGGSAEGDGCSWTLVSRDGGIEGAGAALSVGATVIGSAAIDVTGGSVVAAGGCVVGAGGRLVTAGNGVRPGVVVMAVDGDSIAGEGDLTEIEISARSGEETGVGSGAFVLGGGGALVSGAVLLDVCSQYAMATAARKATSSSGPKRRRGSPSDGGAGAGVGGFGSSGLGSCLGPWLDLVGALLSGCRRRNGGIWCSRESRAIWYFSESHAFAAAFLTRSSASEAAACSPSAV